MTPEEHIKAKPFVKWAGGKTQLLHTFADYYPDALKEGKIKRYIEPFIGSGAVLFDLGQRYAFEEIHMWDINPEIIIVYETIKKEVDALIAELRVKEDTYLTLDATGRKEYYYTVRNDFNRALDGFDFTTFDQRHVERASQFIFLNKTCFNGLFRVNKKGHFNVPIGAYKYPVICDEQNLLAAHRFLQNVSIHLGDYRNSKPFVNEETLVYFDPPYRPLNFTSSFTSYSQFDFNDEHQMELANYYKELSELGAYVMLSNSDPKNTDPNDHFFDDLYSGFTIHRVSAKRFINSKATKRGEINEILVLNY